MSPRVSAAIATVRAMPAPRVATMPRLELAMRRARAGLCAHCSQPFGPKGYCAPCSALWTEHAALEGRRYSTERCLDELDADTSGRPGPTIRASLVEHLAALTEAIAVVDAAIAARGDLAPALVASLAAVST